MGFIFSETDGSPVISTCLRTNKNGNARIDRQVLYRLLCSYFNKNLTGMSMNLEILLHAGLHRIGKRKKENGPCDSKGLYVFPAGLSLLY